MHATVVFRLCVDFFYSCPEIVWNTLCLFHMLFSPFRLSLDPSILFMFVCRKASLIMPKAFFFTLLIVHHNASMDIYICILYNNHFNVHPFTFRSCCNSQNREQQPNNNFSQTALTVCITIQHSSSLAIRKYWTVQTKKKKVITYFWSQQFSEALPRKKPSPLFIAMSNACA